MKKTEMDILSVKFGFDKIEGCVSSGQGCAESMGRERSCTHENISHPFSSQRHALYFDSCGKAQ